MEVSIEVETEEGSEIIGLYRVVSITDEGSVTDDDERNEIEVVIHKDTEIPDEIELCVAGNVDLRTFENIRIEEPGWIWFENAKIVGASEDY